MRVLDLFAGLKGWSDPWKARGHETFSIDLDERFDVDAHLDIMDVEAVMDALPWTPDVILASPPCESFSVMTIGRNWNLDHTPKTDKARMAMDLVKATKHLILEIGPSYFVIENPRAKLRKLDILTAFERRTVTYCQLGDKVMKPTDLWGGFPPSLVLPEMCRPRASCHIPAARGSKTGTQGAGLLDGLHESSRAWVESLPERRGTKFRGGMIEQMARFPSWSPERKALSALRAKIPERLSILVCEAAERDMAALEAAA